jgi:hypothetical protein
MVCVQIAGSHTSPPCTTELLTDEAQNVSASRTAMVDGCGRKKLPMTILVTSVLCLFNEPYGSNGPSHSVGGTHGLAEET